MSVSVLARYQPEGVLGTGPLGKVYTALEKATGRRVAFRGFTQPEGADPEHWRGAMEEYTRELETARKLDHPGIAKLYEFGEESGLYYVISEWFDGESLHERLRRGERFDVEQALSIVGQAGRAFEYAAEQGVLHGDVTPYNLIVGRSGSVHVINFGLAHCRPKDDSLHRAPEELLGKPATTASDLFGLGLILFELIEGRHPFAAGHPRETQEKILRAPTPPLSKATPQVQAIVHKLLAKRASERYQSWAEVAADVAQSRMPAAPATQRLEGAPASTPGGPSLAQYKLHTSDVLRVREKARALKAQRTLVAGRWRRGTFKLVFAVLLLALVSHVGGRRATENAVRIASVSGTADRVSLQNQARSKLTAGQKLAALDQLRTGKKASLQLALGDGSRLVLGPDSLLTLREVRFRPKTRTRARLFYLEKGSLLSRVAHRPSQMFVVYTPRGAAVARGTEFNVNVEADGVHVQTLSGMVHAKNDAGYVPVGPGQETSLPEEAAPPKPQAIDPKDLAGLQKLLGGMEADAGFGSAATKLLDSFEDATVTRLADVLQGISGLSGGSLNLKQGSARARAQNAMHALVYMLEIGEHEDGYPDTLNPRTLAEIGASEESREQILGQFQGKKLAYYKKTPSGYEIAARAQDEAGTLIIARNGKVSVAEKE